MLNVKTKGYSHRAEDGGGKSVRRSASGWLKASREGEGDVGRAVARHAIRVRGDIDARDNRRPKLAGGGRGRRDTEGDVILVYVRLAIVKERHVEWLPGTEGIWRDDASDVCRGRLDAAKKGHEEDGQGGEGFGEGHHDYFAR